LLDTKITQSNNSSNIKCNFIDGVMIDKEYNAREMLKGTHSSRDNHMNNSDFFKFKRQLHKTNL